MRAARCWGWQRSVLAPFLSRGGEYMMHIDTYSHGKQFSAAPFLYVDYYAICAPRNNYRKGLPCGCYCTLISLSFPSKWPAFYSCNRRGSPAYNCIPSDIKSPTIHYSSADSRVFWTRPSCYCLFSGWLFWPQSKRRPLFSSKQLFCYYQIISLRINSQAVYFHCLLSPQHVNLCTS